MRRPQRWWPDFLFHCTDVRNVVNFLRTGEMLSRTKIVASRQLLVDIASPEVTAHTNDIWQDYVRLYFRPKTPTQFRNEGFRPTRQRDYHAQCPVPVYLIIDAMEVLSKAGVMFTDGNVAAGAQPTGDIEFFQTILSRQSIIQHGLTLQNRTGLSTTATLKSLYRNSSPRPPFSSFVAGARPNTKHWRTCYCPEHLAIEWTKLGCARS